MVEGKHVEIVEDTKFSQLIPDYLEPLRYLLPESMGAE